MRRLPKISEAEWEVMRVLWERAPLTANEIVETLSKRRAWQRETIRTLINRLVQKKAVRFKARGRQYHYSPAVAEAQCIQAETRTLLSRFRGRALEPMLAALVQEQRLTPEQIARLKEILDDKDADGKHAKRE